ncbi:hypothetical protein E6O75_ATG10870 [Venturia nashicola]|uniref:Uncharacterized protein n=1 Tax=Venturia nashicola TaxID=86259 RepID=A0A4Z1PAL6_9PEZI|nr:hypothetical protein E6O75_ATG10870 [Venturia nashicola]
MSIIDLQLHPQPSSIQPAADSMPISGLQPASHHDPSAHPLCEPGTVEIQGPWPPDASSSDLLDQRSSLESAHFGERHTHDFSHTVQGRNRPPALPGQQRTCFPASTSICDLADSHDCKGPRDLSAR